MRFNDIYCRCKESQRLLNRLEINNEKTRYTMENKKIMTKVLELTGNIDFLKELCKELVNSYNDLYETEKKAIIIWIY